jgi:hypothetical protein
MPSIVEKISELGDEPAREPQLRRSVLVPQYVQAVLAGAVTVTHPVCDRKDAGPVVQNCSILGRPQGVNTFLHDAVQTAAMPRDAVQRGKPDKHAT